MIHEDRCTGCRACELACSYHFARLFNRKISSIEVTRYFDEGQINIRIHKTPAQARRACDLCAGDQTPMCAKYCATNAIEFRS
jgi:Fe-S-cluster-containing dehydrogenase component